MKRVLFVVAFLVAGCASGGGATVKKGPPLMPIVAPQTYVAVGASETVGYGADDPLSQSWPQVLFHTAFPASTVYTNVGIPGETVAAALQDELPLALSLKPRVVTVWLNINDALARVSAETYEAQLDQLVHALRNAAGPGRTTVLVANTPPAQELPAYLACIPDGSSYPGYRSRARCQVDDPSQLPSVAGVEALVASYNAATTAVVTKEGASLVDLHSLGDSAGGGFDSLIGRDGFHPSTAGHVAVAAAFAAVIAKLGIEPAPKAAPTATAPAPTATAPAPTATAHKSG